MCSQAFRFSTDLPVVGVTPNHFDPDRNGAPNPEGSYYLNRPYVDAVRAAGAVPVVFPYVPPGPEVEAMLSRVDALVMTGGFDVDMQVLGEDLHPEAGRVHPERLRFELDLARRAAARDLPVLGVCLGLQTINLAFGGGLVQHIPDVADGSVDHARPEPERRQAVHDVEVVPGTLLHRLVGETRLGVNSLHHQAAGEPGEGIVVSARAADGVVEALEMPSKRFYLAVQWHPEELPDHPAQRRLFEALVEATRVRSEERAA